MNEEQASLDARMKELVRLLRLACEQSGDELAELAIEAERLGLPVNINVNFSLRIVSSPIAATNREGK